MAHTLESLKAVMGTAKNVDEWNDLRNKAKELCPIETTTTPFGKITGRTLINQLDVSGYVTEVSVKNNWPSPVKK